MSTHTEEIIQMTEEVENDKMTIDEIIESLEDHVVEKLIRVDSNEELLPLLESDDDDDTMVPIKPVIIHKPTISKVRSKRSWVKRGLIFGAIGFIVGAFVI